MAYRQNGMACLGIWSILGANPFPSLDSKRSPYVIRIVRAGFLDRDWRPDLRGSSDACAGPLDRRRRYRAARNRNCHGCTKYSAERSFLTRFVRGRCRLLLLERCGPHPYSVLCECYALRLVTGCGSSQISPIMQNGSRAIMNKRAERDFTGFLF
jgi:hypothetical protein